MPDTGFSTVSKAIAETAAAAAPALAAVHAGGRHTSSAIAWREGLYVAASEAIDSEDGILIGVGAAAPQQAEFLGRDPTTGIALIKGPKAEATMPPNAPPAPFGSLVVAVGRGEEGPLAGLAVVAEAGPAWRSMRGGLIDRRIRLSGQLDGRLEGGAALDAEGRLIGLVLFGPRRRALVIPAETVERVAAVLAEKGHVPRGYLGAGLHPVRQRDLRGAMVMSLDEAGPAAAAGLLVGDIVTTWDGTPVEGVHDVIRRLGPDSVGKEVALEVLRGGAAQRLAVTVGIRPEA